jgi:dihydrolipoamide dehydrogenase
MSKGVQFLMKKIKSMYWCWKTKTWKKLDVTDENNKVTEYSADHIIIATGASRELPNLHKMVKSNWLP